MKYLWPLLILLNGCTTWDKKSCDATNWREYGAADAAVGKAHSRFGRYDYLHACRKGDVARYKAAYEQGVLEEMIKICTYEGGYVFGQKNYEAKIGMCGAQEKEFRAGYLQALNEAAAKRRPSRP